jgi:hypothetical protein
MGEKLSTIEPVQTLLRLFPEPEIVFDVLFKNLPDVLIGTTMIFSGDSVNLRFQLRLQM